MSIRPSLSRIAAWLGIFAMLLTVAMPLGTQLAADDARFEAAPCSAVSPDAPRPSDPRHLHHHAACGYCNLLAHWPALHNARPSITPFVRAKPPYPVASAPHAIVHARHPHRNSRAPPPTD